MAAGIGSRYGGVKQLDGIGPSGETIMDYSIFDAIDAGYTKVVFIIRKELQEAFDNHYKERFKGKIDFEFVYQDEFKKWVEIARGEGQTDAAAEIDKALELMAETDAALEKALELLGGKVEGHHHHH